MRYHWGLGVGHLHAHQPRSTATSSYTPCQPGDTKDDQYAEPEPEGAEGRVDYDGHEPSAEPGDNASDIYESDDSELRLDERDLEGWEDVESDDGGDLDGNCGLGDEDEDEEEFGGIY
jgi:hypothetical protein